MSRESINWQEAFAWGIKEGPQEGFIQGSKKVIRAETTGMTRG